MDETPTEPFPTGALPTELLFVINPYHDGLHTGSKQIRFFFISNWSLQRKAFIPGFSLVIADHVKNITYSVTNDDCNKPDVV